MKRGGRRSVLEALERCGLTNGKPGTTATIIRVSNPVTNIVESLEDVILQLVDVHDWKRRQVIDWLRSLPDEVGENAS